MVCSLHPSPKPQVHSQNGVLKQNKSKKKEKKRQEGLLYLGIIMVVLI